MRIFFFILSFIAFADMATAQYFTEQQISVINGNKTAAEGDLYMDTTNNIQYIGVTTGELKAMGNSFYSSDGKLNDDRTLDGNLNNLVFSNIDSSKIESNIIELDGDVLINGVTESDDVSKNLVIDSDGKIYTRPETQAQSDIILVDPSSVTITGSGYRTIHEFNLPGGTFGTNNVVRINMFMRRTSGSGSLRLRVEYDGDIIAQMPNFNGNNPCKTEIFAFGAGSTNSQRAYIYHSNSGSNGLGTDSSNKNSNNNLNIKISGDLSSDGNQWVCDFIIVEAIR